MKPEIPDECTNCGQQSLYQADARSGGLFGPNYLAGLNSFGASADFTIVICENCGLTRFFTDPHSLKKLKTNHGWKKR